MSNMNRPNFSDDLLQMNSSPLQDEQTSLIVTATDAYNAGDGLTAVAQQLEAAAKARLAKISN